MLHSELEAVKLAVHASDANSLLTARNSSARAARHSNHHQLLKNDIVKDALDKCTYELAVTQQRVDIQRAISSARRRSNPSGSNGVEPIDKAGDIETTAATLSKFLNVHGGVSRARSCSDTGERFSVLHNGKSDQDAARAASTMLTEKRVYKMQRELSLRTIAAITALQVRFRRKLAKKKAEEAERQRIKEEIRRLKRSATKSMMQKS